MLVSLALMTVDHRQHHLESVRAGLSVLIYPLQYGLNLPLAAGDWINQSFATRETLREENGTLRARQLLIEARLQKMLALETENVRLRELLDSSFKVGERVLIAELMAVDLDPFSSQILINRGSRHEVYVGQPLVDAHGMLGQVVHVSPYTSTALLITDPDHALPVWVNRNGLRAIVVGAGANRLELPHLPTNVDIRPGDLLVTSGLDGRFPSGYPVAVVEHVDIQPGQTFASITARPTAQLERNREVLLVWPAQREDEVPADCPEGPPCPPADAEG